MGECRSSGADSGATYKWALWAAAPVAAVDSWVPGEETRRDFPTLQIDVYEGVPRLLLRDVKSGSGLWKRKRQEKGDRQRGQTERADDEDVRVGVRNWVCVYCL